MIDKIFISMLILIGMSGILLIIYSANYDNEFISKCEAKGGVPKVGKGIHVCIKPESIIEIN